MSGSGLVVGSTRTFTCSAGYRLNGSSPITCVNQGLNADWSDDVPTCDSEFTLTIFITIREPYRLFKFSTYNINQNPMASRTNSHLKPGLHVLLG